VRCDHLRHGLGSGLGLGLRLGLGAVLLLWAPADPRAQIAPHDSSLPIEITADRLDVVQPERVATFSGNVDAVQGDMVLSADQLRVYYNGNAPGAGPTTVGGGSIERIEAEGNVFLSSPRQTAQGKTGVYDVAKDQLTLEGSVVLTQGDDVIRGDRLEVDLASGHSRVLAAVPASAGGAAPQRVRALFVPQAGAPAPAAGPAGAEAKAAPAPPAPPAVKPPATQ
jgi:lipopolysaccharide export system protein LptA